MFDPNSISIHRLRALLNGFAIGLGLAVVVFVQNPMGILFIAAGIGMEYWHRQRIKRGQ